jgi:short-subunit dehydrogenase
MRELFENTDFAVCTNMMNVDCMSHIALTKGILPMMIKQKSG